MRRKRKAEKSKYWLAWWYNLYRVYQLMDLSRTVLYYITHSHFFFPSRVCEMGMREIRFVGQKMVVLLICVVLFDVCASDTVRNWFVILLELLNLFFFLKLSLIGTSILKGPIFLFRHLTSRLTVSWMLLGMNNLKVWVAYFLLCRWVPGFKYTDRWFYFYFFVIIFYLREYSCDQCCLKHWIVCRVIILFD